MFSLSDEKIKRGVGTHSSGNHAAAVALAAKLRGIKAHVVMPKNAPEIKKKINIQNLDWEFKEVYLIKLLN